MSKSQLEVEVVEDDEEEEERDSLVLISSSSGAPCSKRSNRSNIAVSRQKGKLDSNMFEYYMENLWRNFSEDKRAWLTYLDCLWFSLYMKESCKTKVLTWIKRKHIFWKKYVFVPIICWSHWSLLILCNLGENPQSETRKPCMLLLDSLQMADQKGLEPEIRKFVMDIYRVEERPEHEELISRIPLLVPKVMTLCSLNCFINRCLSTFTPVNEAIYFQVPQQRNGEECGNFVLYFINLFVESAPENFSIEGYPYFMKEDWFGLEDFDCFCNKLKFI